MTAKERGAKVCPRCKVDKPLADFPCDKSKASGRATLCRVCDNLKSKRYYAANRERVIARVQARRAKESSS
jgi:hypothetical protein